MNVSFSKRLRQYMSANNMKQKDVLELVEPYFKTENIKFNKAQLSQYVSGNVIPRQEKNNNIKQCIKCIRSLAYGF